MSRFHPDQIERARRNVVTHDPRVPAQTLRTARVIQWIILRDGRPTADIPACKILPFAPRTGSSREPLCGMPPFGGDAA